MPWAKEGRPVGPQSQTATAIRANGLGSLSPAQRAGYGNGHIVIVKPNGA